MNNLYCPKKSNHSCAWCNSRHTVIVSSDERKYPPFPPEFNPFPKYPHPHDEDNRFYGKKYWNKKKPCCDEDYGFPHVIKKHNPNNFIIHCHDCNKYSNVKSLYCRYCHNHETVITRIGPHIDPDVLFNPKYLEDFVCRICRHNPPKPPCRHEWVKHSGEIFSECTAINFICTLCGEKKTTYSNQDRDPFGRDNYDFYY
jgi:hypothetical protein